VWQQYLEYWFPASIRTKKGRLEDRWRGSDVKNTAMKFVLDMTLGATVNTVLFIAIIGALKGMGRGEIVEACNNVSVLMRFRVIIDAHRDFFR
jgi:hypothetical protein